MHNNYHSVIKQPPNLILISSPIECRADYTEVSQYISQSIYTCQYITTRVHGVNDMHIKSVNHAIAIQCMHKRANILLKTHMSQPFYLIFYES